MSADRHRSVGGHTPGIPPEPVDSAGHQVRDETPQFPGGLPGVGELAQRANRTLWGDAWLRLRKNRLAVIGLVWIIFMISLTATADLWVPRVFGDPTASAYNSLEPPSSAHPFGTDRLGRDVFSRVVYGARISLAVGLLAVSISLVLGLLFGALSGYYGGILDAFVMR